MALQKCVEPFLYDILFLEAYRQTIRKHGEKEIF